MELPIAALPVIHLDRYVVTAILLGALILVLLARAIRYKPFLSFLLLTGLLLVAGLLISSFGFPYLPERFTAAFGDALMIASILALRSATKNQA